MILITIYSETWLMQWHHWHVYCCDSLS